MEAKLKTLIEKNFQKTEDLGNIFSTMTEVSHIQNRIKTIIEPHKNDAMQILNEKNLETVSALHIEIKKITKKYTWELQEIFAIEFLEENLEFIKWKLEERRKDIISTINTIPLNKISFVEDMLSSIEMSPNYENYINWEGEERMCKVDLESELSELIYEQADPYEQKRWIAVRLCNWLREGNIRTVGDFINLWDSKSKEKWFIFDSDFHKYRNIWAKTLNLLWKVLLNKVFAKYTVEDANRIKKLIQSKRFNI